ncbi:DUF4129 domain-containing protein [Streptomyces sp. TR06-5]|uniref:DUF4129 domain-containing protein n=1 Tax=unclassified Streptomyces TaxID=2593676 RepID=UPI0039A0EE32
MAAGATAAAVRGDDVPVTILRDPARHAAERELSDPIYRQNEPGLFRRAVDWFFGKLGDLLGSAADATPGGVVGLVVVGVALVLLATALWARLGRPGRQSGPAAPALFDSHVRSAAEHRAAAADHAAAQRWNEAVQETVRGLVRSLEERALLEPRPGRTADEAADEAGAALPAHAAALRSAATSFDEVTYADRTADEAAYARLRSLDEAVRRTVPRSAGPEGGR